LINIPSSTLFTNLAGAGGIPLQIRIGGDFFSEGGWRFTSVCGGDCNFACAEYPHCLVGHQKLRKEEMRDIEAWGERYMVKMVNV